MSVISINFVKTHEDAVLPKRNHGDSFDFAHDGDSGYDLTCVEDTIVPARGSCVVPVGLQLGYITHGYWLRIESRSGNAFKRGLTAFNGIIDSQYRGSLDVLIFNNRDEDCLIKKGERIAQLIIYPLFSAHCSFIDHPIESNRGNKGFGSSDSTISTATPLIN